MPESDLVLEKGVRVMISLLGLHNDPQYFPDPEKFDPERFAPGKKETIKPFSYLPFGEGPRICIGKLFSKERKRGLNMGGNSNLL